MGEEGKFFLLVNCVCVCVRERVHAMLDSL